MLSITIQQRTLKTRELEKDLRQEKFNKNRLQLIAASEKIRIQ